MQSIGSRDPLPHYNEGIAVFFDSGSRTSLPAKIGAGFQHKHQVTAMLRPQFLCAPDNALRVPRGPGTRPDFLDLGREQPELPGALYHELLSHIGVMTQRLQVKNKYIPRTDRLAAPRARTRFVGPDISGKHPGPKRSAQYPASKDSIAHPLIIAGNYFVRLSTGVLQQTLDKVGRYLPWTGCSGKAARPFP